MALFQRKKVNPKKSGLEKQQPKKDTKDDKKSSQRKRKEVSITSRAYRVLARPLITEKGTDLSVINKYLFEIDMMANKSEAKKAIEEVYGVTVTKVNIINFQGKQRRYGRVMGRTRSWKKAIITLKDGDSIELFEGV